MIFVSINEANFEYDIHSLVQAFYPGREVLVRVFSQEELRTRADEAEFFLLITYGEDAIRFALYPGADRFGKVGSGSGGETAGSRDSAGDAARTAQPALTNRVFVDPADRRGMKNRLKQTLYRLLADYSGRTLPWGTLTGIRPVKIPMDMLENGRSEDEIRAYMRGTYFASDEKISLSIEIAERERALLAPIDYENGYSLYIGIPFCPSTCLYCSFPSFSIEAWRGRVEEYLDALGREITETARMMDGKHLNSVYIGGGTPTSLSPAQLDRLLKQIGECFHLNDAAGTILYGGLAGGQDAHPLNRLTEFTVEAGRPDSITREKLKVLTDHNISRISINPQTMKEETLRLIGRCHTVEQIRQAFALAREMGFDNINMDLIVGLPEETIDDVRRTMDEIEALGPDSVTVHSLAVKRAARLKTEQENYAHLRIENTWDIIRLTSERCRGMSLYPYYLYRQKNMAGNFENVGYAAPGKEGIYNILIMEEKQTILALGAGATTKAVFDHGRRIERVGNVKDVGIYIDRVDEMIEKKKNFLEKYL